MFDDPDGQGWYPFDLPSEELPGCPSRQVYEAWQRVIWEDDPWDALAPIYPAVPAELGAIAVKQAWGARSRSKAPHDHVFTFCRVLMGERLDLADEEPCEALKPILEVFREGSVSLGPLDPAQDRSWFLPDMFWLEFVDGWAAVKHPYGSNAFRLAASRAVRYPVRLNREAFGARYSPPVEEVASIAYQLQKLVGDEPILLPVKLIGEHFGYKGDNARVAGSRVRKPLQDKGLLHLVEKHVPGVHADRLHFNFKRLNLYTPPE